MTDSLRALVDATGTVGPIVFVALYCILTVAMVPGTTPSLAAGVLFGPVFGTLLTLVGAVLGAAAAFELARGVGRDRLRARFEATDRSVGRQGLTGVSTLRLVPVVPFDALNDAFGLSSTRRHKHHLGTAVGIVPGTVAFVVLGSSIGDPASIGFLASLTAVLLLVLGSVRRTRRSAVRAATSTAA